jgi:hypothetical protein
MGVKKYLLERRLSTNSDDYQVISDIDIETDEDENSNCKDKEFILEPKVKIVSKGLFNIQGAMTNEDEMRQTIKKCITIIFLKVLVKIRQKKN